MRGVMRPLAQGRTGRPMQALHGVQIYGSAAMSQPTVIVAHPDAGWKSPGAGARPAMAANRQAAKLVWIKKLPPSIY
jgi:hypothetical protein